MRSRSPAGVVPIVAILVQLVVLISPGCGPSNDEVRVDVQRYLEQVRAWAPTEAETARTIDRILKTQFVDDDEVRRQVEADAPRVERHIAEAVAVRPATRPVQQIHDRYVGAWRDLATGYRRILSGIDSTSATDIADGRRALEGWRAAIVTTAHDLRRLAEETNAADGSPAPAG
jgi:hypothetical protein